MDLHVDAIFDDGVLKPLAPLSLPDKAVVTITIYGAPRCAPGVEPRDDWERGLLNVARNCGVSLPDVAVSSEGLYE